MQNMMIISKTAMKFSVCNVILMIQKGNHYFSDGGYALSIA